MTRPRQLDVLYEDNHLLVVVKPAGIPTQGVSSDRESLLVLAREYVKRKYGKPGNVYLGVVSRLDTPVSGAIVFARTSKSARRLNEQFRARTVRKVYWALVEGNPSPSSGECVDWVIHDDRRRRMQIARPGTAEAQEARLAYRRVRTFSGISLLEVELQTGRKHQIRVQLAHRGWPIVGDTRYGSRHSFPAGIALHARRLMLVHPTQGDDLDFVAPLPSSWAGFGVRDPGPEQSGSDVR
jgi:23S rRNA pseudouridine1911/1915/1917 synthase